MLVPSLSEWFSGLLSPLVSLGTSVQAATTSTGFWGGFLLGLATGLLWTPCAGPILATITTLVATRSNTFASFSLVLTYAIGAAVPLLLIALGVQSLLRSSSLSNHLTKIRQGFGLVTMFTAMAIVFHWDSLLGQKIAQYVPTVIVDQNETVETQLKQLEQSTPQPSPLHSPKVLHHTFTSYGPAPEFMGLTNWINSPPLSLNELRGKVVLIDFWTYSCINCLRTLPHLEEWYNKYRDKGFVIIGIHTPEFEFEKSPTNVIEAISRLGITYPVAQDNDYTVWREYNNRYWPTHYLVDQNGQIVKIVIGEGNYQETEMAIQALLGISETIQSLPKTSHKQITPETHLGTNRGTNYADEISIIPNQTVTYTYSKPLQEDKIGLQGPWKAEPECITAEGDDCYLSINCLASNVYIVLGGSSGSPVEVSVDEKPSKEFYVNLSQKYDIINKAYGRHIVLLKVPRGISAYTFTFGDD